MNSFDAAKRHLSREGFLEYLRSGAPSVLKIDGTPLVYIAIEPVLGKLSLRTAWTGQAIPDLSAYLHISAGTVYWNDAPWCELCIEGNISEAYPILCSMADRLQLQAADFSGSVTAALASLKDLLAAAPRLSDAQEIGLFGELLLLEQLLDRLPYAEALACWRGPEGEEHDFALLDGDVEAKSTTTERQRHWINDARQMEPTVDRRLWLASIQLTGGGSGGSTLSELIERLRSILMGDPCLGEFDCKIAAAGWQRDHSELYVRKLRLRSRPVYFDVDSTFPALTPSKLAAAGIEHSRLLQLRYMLDLEGLEPSTDLPRELRASGHEV